MASGFAGQHYRPPLVRMAKHAGGNAMTLKLLVTGDIHLGMRSTGPGEHLSVRPMWEEIVPKLAVKHDVDLVVLTGDIVEHANRLFEAQGSLRRGVERLLQDGIEVVAVSGNHDHDVFPGMVDAVDRPGFRLLGRDATWERLAWPNDREPQVYLEGWSFPDRSSAYRNDPLAAYDLPSLPRSGLPVVGVLHGDLPGGAAGGSKYAPLTVASLARPNVDVWLLGHIHKPGVQQEDAPKILYPGSPQALDPSETGDHGPWLVEIAPGGRFTAAMLPASPIQYAALPVDISGAETVPGVYDTIMDRVAAWIDAYTERAAEPLQALHVRATLTGRSVVAAELREGKEFRPSEFHEEYAGVAVSLDPAVQMLAHLPLDLAATAKEHNPLGILCQRILELEADGGGGEALVRDAQQALTDVVWHSSAYRDLADRDQPPEHEVRELLHEAAYALADTLRDQQQGSDTP